MGERFGIGERVKAPRIVVLASDPESALDVSRASSAIHFSVEPRVVADPLAAASDLVASGAKLVGIVTDSSVMASALLALARKASTSRARVVLACLDVRDEAKHAADLASDVGIVGTTDVRPFAGALALLAAKADAPWNASLRALRGSERARSCPLVAGAAQ